MSNLYYTYCWNSHDGGPCTDDPRLVELGYLPYGKSPINVVRVDGKDVSDLLVFRLKTGPDGFVDHKTADDNWSKGGPGGEIDWERLTGNVEYAYDLTLPHGKCYLSGRPPEEKV
jgi:hypothetical protein